MISKFLYILRERKLLKSKSDNALKLFNTNQVIFFHIPKTGGNSILKSLYGNIDFGHRDVAYYKAIFGKNKFNSFYKFCVVRNPYERLYSAYSFLKKGGMNKMDKDFNDIYLKKYHSFDDFVKNGLNNKHIKNWIHFKPQHSFILDKNNQICVDFVAKLENIENDFNIIKDKLQIRDVCLSHLNKTKKDPLTMTPEIKQIIQKHYQKDFELFYKNLL